MFIPESSIEINFEYWLIDLISFIDVSSILADRIEINSDDNFEMFCDMLLIRNSSMKLLYVCLFQTDS